MNKLNILATTISGSTKDWGKLDSLQDTFESYYDGDVEVYILDSHNKLKEKASELIKQGHSLFVSAGGAGTFKSTVDGVLAGEPNLDEIRIAFLRKGSADLIGKVLGVPDDLEEAAKLICENIKKDNVLPIDVIDILEDEKVLDHFVGFSGLGIFGLVPYFTESRFNKYYKGILGSLFGDRGPFVVGLILSTIKFYLQKTRHGSFSLEIETSEKTYPKEKYSSIIIVNGDLGKDFRIAPGSSLSDGKVNLALFIDRGILNSIKQAKAVWGSEDINRKTELGIKSIETSKLTISTTRDNLDINVDGLKATAKGNVTYKTSNKLKLIKCK